MKRSEGVFRKRKLAHTDQGYPGLEPEETGEKIYDLSVSGGADTMTLVTNAQLLNGMVRGDDIGQHDGREIIMTRLQLRWRATNTAATPSFGRVLVVYDTQTNGTALTSGDLVGDPPPIVASSVYKHIEYQNRRRFIVLRDEILLLGPTAQFERTLIADWDLRIDMPVIYNSGNAGTVADISMGSLYVVSWSTAAAGGGTFSFDSRLGYFDD